MTRYPERWPILWKTDDEEEAGRAGRGRARCRDYRTSRRDASGVEGIEGVMVVAWREVYRHWILSTGVAMFGVWMDWCAEEVRRGGRRTVTGE